VILRGSVATLSGSLFACHRRQKTGQLACLARTSRFQQQEDSSEKLTVATAGAARTVVGESRIAAIPKPEGHHASNQKSQDSTAVCRRAQGQRHHTRLWIAVEVAITLYGDIAPASFADIVTLHASRPAPRHQRPPW